MLQRCFALYLNYPFGWRDAVLRQTSFPTKLTTYIRAARPLLLHAPRDSTLAPLAAEAPYVLGWDSLDEAAGERVLTRAWEDRRLHSSAHEGAETIRARYFDVDRHRRAMLGALDGLVPPLDQRSGPQAGDSH